MKYSIKEVYTPDDASLDRKRLERTFRSDAKSAAEIVRAGINDTGHYEFAFEFVDEIAEQLTNASDDANQWTVTICANDGEYQFTVERLTQTPETPLTADGLLTWAQNRVATNLWRDEKPNTVELELIDLCYNYQTTVLQEYDAGELIGLVSDLWMHGVKGYLAMTRDELINELLGQEFEDYTTVEELFEAYSDHS